MKSTLSHFYASFAFCVLAVVAAYFIGGIQAAITVSFLTLLETALSFDNAVVNATVLNNWDEAWRRRFLTWGILVAVFGMRLVFPLLIVGIVGELDAFAALDLAINSPDEYARLIASAHHQIAAFGGTFLMMVFLKFFVDSHKTVHWLSLLEKPLTRLGKMEAIEAALTLAALMLLSGLMDTELRGEFIAAGVWGVITFVLVKGLTALVGGHQGAGHQVIRQGVAGFLYLELLDASFSFDGVVGAFAMTNNVFIITLGLGAGAMFVRSFTLLLVEKGTLGTYRYLEHGAFWAIGALSVMMLVGAKYHVPEAVTGLLGAGLITFSLGSSILSRRKLRAKGLDS